MPLLSDEHLKRMREEPEETCSGCNRNVKKNYCRSCDEFFFEGHDPHCAAMRTDEPFTDNHQGHRTY